MSLDFDKVSVISNEVIKNFKNNYFFLPFFCEKHNF